MSPAEFIEDSNRWGERDFFYRDLSSYGCTNCHDSMTWQFGDQRHCKYRSNLSRHEVLRRAKEFVANAAFVGFYECLDTDFWRLRQQFFKDVQLPFYIPLAFWFGTLLAIPRLRVTKYALTLPETDLNVIHKYNQLDLDLYNFARARYKPDLVLYPDYKSFMLDNLAGISAVMISIVGVMYLCSRILRFACSSRKPEQRDLQ